MGEGREVGTQGRKVKAVKGQQSREEGQGVGSQGKRVEQSRAEGRMIDSEKSWVEQKEGREQGSGRSVGGKL